MLFQTDKGTHIRLSLCGKPVIFKLVLSCVSHLFCHVGFFKVCLLYTTFICGLDFRRPWIQAVEFTIIYQQ